MHRRLLEESNWAFGVKVAITYRHSRSQPGDQTLCKVLIGPVPGVRPTCIPFEKDVNLGVMRKLDKGFHGIVRRVGSHQRSFPNDLSGAPQHLRKKAEKSLRGILTALPKLNAQAPALPAQLSADGCVAVLTLIRPRNPSFPGAVIVQTESVQVQGYVSPGRRRYGTWVFSRSSGLLSLTCSGKTFASGSKRCRKVSTLLIMEKGSGIFRLLRI